MSEGLDLEVYKDIPGYKGILKAVLKNQIQHMVRQLAEHTGEESILLSASVSDGTFSHLGSDFGKDFLRGHDEVKAKFLGFCLEKYHKRKREDRFPPAKRFASSSHRSKGSSSSPRGQGSTTSTPAHMSYISPEEIQAGNTPSRRERTLDQPRKVPRDNLSSGVQSRLPFLSEPNQSENYQTIAVKVEIDTDQDREVPEVTASKERGVREKHNSGEESFERPSSEHGGLNADNSYTQLKGTGSSYDYVLDHDSETDSLPLPWQPNGAFSNDRQQSSKRKQAVPVRHVQSINPQELGFPEDELPTEIDLTDSIINKDGKKIKSGNARYSPNSQIAGETKSSGALSDEVRYSLTSDLTFGDVNSQAWPGSSHSDLDSPRTTAAAGDSDSAGSKNYIKTPQIDGLLVSRGEGRFEKLIKCDICSKICRTSNMARHKKRYCLGFQKGSASPNSYSGVGSQGEWANYSSMDPYTKMEYNELDDMGSGSS